MHGRLAVAAGGLLVLVGCGSASSVSAPPTAPTSSTVPTSTPPAPVAVACQDGRVSIAVTQSLTVRCGALMKLRLTGAALRQTGPDDFSAVESGTATILLTGGPACSAGTLCPQYRIDAGLISVTVR
jgi:hypothetical protein